MKIIEDLSETYHSIAGDSLANHNDLKSYRLLAVSALILKYTISKKGRLDPNHVQLGVLVYGVLLGFFTLPDIYWQ